MRERWNCLKKTPKIPEHSSYISPPPRLTFYPSIGDHSSCGYPSAFPTLYPTPGALYSVEVHSWIVVSRGSHVFGIGALCSWCKYFLSRQVWKCLSLFNLGRTRMIRVLGGISLEANLGVSLSPGVLCSDGEMRVDPCFGPLRGNSTLHCFLVMEKSGENFQGSEVSVFFYYFQFSVTDIQSTPKNFPPPHSSTNNRSQYLRIK